MFEILLTRIFSVTLSYHFAFVAISVAMFGMTVGAVIVYQFPDRFTHERARPQMATHALLFGLFSLGSVVVHLTIPFFGGGSWDDFGSLVPIYAITSVPFVFGGICVCIALTKHGGHVGRLYGADLAGAATGCIALVYALMVTDAPTAVMMVASLGAIAAILFAGEEGNRDLRRLMATCAALLVLLTVSHIILVRLGWPILRVSRVKGTVEEPVLYEKWNSFSRITVSGDPTETRTGTGWGMSPFVPSFKTVRELYLRIDSAAGTPLTSFGSDLRNLEYLKYDIVNLAHHIRSHADVLAIGAGGGRDLLSALVFGQRSVVGVEINEAIIRAVNGRFADFTGHLYRDPRITFVNDEARSYIARQTSKFDIIQISLIDTWAATAAGAFVFTENSLYTVEGWEVLLGHLAPRGILTTTRWYLTPQPTEIYRMTALATTTLARMGVEKPRDHIMIVRRMRTPLEMAARSQDSPAGVGCLLVSIDPFSARDLDIMKSVTQRWGFEVVMSPEHSFDSNLERLSSISDLEAFVDGYPVNIAAPTDDNPFFFHMLRIGDAFDPAIRKAWEQGANKVNFRAVRVLAILLVSVFVLTLLCIILPLFMTTSRATLHGSTPFLFYFASIGMGFMMVEISQLQRLVVFLGHPTYALSVVLFALLLSSGLGSWLTDRSGYSNETRWATIRLSLLLAALTIFGASTPLLTARLEGSVTSLRILAAVLILSGLGFFMGMPFPVGMRLAASRSGSLTPWFWGINGATSVCASVLAVAVALSFGISASYWMGSSFYALALLSLLYARRRGPAPT